MPKMMPPDFDPEWSPVSEEIVFRAVQEYLPDDWYVLHSFHFTSDDPQGKKKDGEIDFLFYNPAVNFAVEESALTDGKPDAAKMKPICFDTCQHVYRLMGDVVAKAFSCGIELKKNNK